MKGNVNTGVGAGLKIYNENIIKQHRFMIMYFYIYSYL